MYYLHKIIKGLSVIVFLFTLAGCAGGETVEEGYYNPDSPAANAWRDEQYGEDENLGPNAPGYVDSGGEFSLDQEVDPQ